jgi:hypothetical protein
MSISRDRETFSVGPGVRWGQVYEFLDPYDVTVVGGRIPQVGVGGLLLGGKPLSFTTGILYDVLTCCRRYILLDWRIWISL